MSYFLFLFLFIYFSLFSVKTLELLSLSHTNTSSNDSGSQCVLIEPQSSCPYNPHSPIVRCEYLYAWRLTSIIGAGRETPPPLFDLKIVYSYVIEVADSESDLGLHGRALVSEIMVFFRIRVTCIFQLNDLFCTTIRGNASINTPST